MSTSQNEKAAVEEVCLPASANSHKEKVMKTKVQSVELADAIAKDNPNYWSPRQLQLYCMMLFATLNCCMNGFDGSVMSSINAMPQWHDYFDVGMTGPTIGLVFAIYTVGNIIGSFFAGWLIDTFGRRSGMAGGSCFIVIGSVIQASSHNIHAFIGGRCLVGIGVPLCVTGAPVYLVEIAYPSWRGIAGGLYNVLGWYIGSLTASWSAYGTANIKSNWSWRILFLIQIVPAIIVLVFVWFIPESPRWLFARAKEDQAMSILTKFHGNGNPDSALVKLECEEIKHSLEFEAELYGGASAWWDYRVLWNTRQARHRMWIIMLLSVFSQFVGGAVISYFLPTILSLVGITSSSQQLLLNGLNTVFSFLGGVAGSFFVDKIGRRPLLLWGFFLTGLVYIPINVLASKSNGDISRESGYAFIAMIFLYGIFASFCISPLQALYPAEILSNDIRAKGLAAQSFISGIASFINTYATPVALGNIGWKTYTIFLVLHFVHWVLMYLATVESKGRSLEELDEIFNDPKPVKRSKQRNVVVVSSGVGVKMSDDS